MADKIHRNSLKIGHQLHWYRVETILGQGGFGITYLAHDLNLDQKVAIKEYLPIELAVREQDFSVHPVSEDRGEKFTWGLDRFISEARTLNKFKHPNIVRVLNVFEANNTAYMVMEYEHGESLQAILTQRKTMEEAELINILIPILGGLQKVHESGFIHRDIKPANIFIRKDDSPVLLDFGSARQALGVATQTLTSLVSPGYAPFEQYYSKSDQQGPWTDIYGLGATVYRAVAGVAPMDAVDRSRTILKGGRDTFVPVAEIGRGRYSERFLLAIDHALQFKEEDRPQSVQEWQRDFSVAGAVEHPARSVLNREAPTGVRTANPVARNPEQAAPAVPRPVAKPQPQHLSQPDDHPPRSRSMGTTVALVLLTMAAVGAGGYYYNQQRTVTAKVRYLLAEAKADFEARRLTSPPGQNALAHYREVQAVVPDNAEAKKGLGAILEIYVGLAEQSLTAGDFEQAAAQLSEAAAIDPAAPGIHLLRGRLDSEMNARREQIEITLDAAAAQADKGDVAGTVAKLTEAESLGAPADEVAKIRMKLKGDIETRAAAAFAESQAALNANDPAKARAALAAAKELKSQADALDNPGQSDGN